MKTSIMTKPAEAKWEFTRGKDGTAESNPVNNEKKQDSIIKYYENIAKRSQIN